MKKVLILTMSLFAAILAFAQQTQTVYLWEALSGSVVENGGKIVQHNGLSISRINYMSSGYSTIQLCGKKENMTDEDNSLNSIYFTITLADGNTFKSGDKISITAMRNNDAGGNANIHFVYGNGTTYDDNNTWANLGQMHEMTFDGGISAKGTYEFGSAQGAGTEPIGSYSLEPNTNTFVVPAEADGSTTFSLTRNESQCWLYITKISISRDVTTGIGVSDTPLPIRDGRGGSLFFTLSGQRVGTNAHGIVIKNRKKIIK